MEEKHQKMLERIYDEVVGDKFTEGLIPKVSRIEKKVNTHEIMIRAVIGVFLVFSALVTFWDDFLSLFNG